MFSGLDKITGRITTFDVNINETVRFGALEVTPRACYTRPPTEKSEAAPVASPLASRSMVNAAHWQIVSH